MHTVLLSVAQYASLSICQGTTIEDARLIEHLVARGVPVTDELSSLRVEFADGAHESSVVRSLRSPWGLLERAASRLWWAGGPLHMLPRGVRPSAALDSQPALGAM